MESVFNMLRPLHFVLLLSAFAFFAFASAIDNKETTVSVQSEIEGSAPANDLEADASAYYGGYGRPYYGGWGGYGRGYGYPGYYARVGYPGYYGGRGYGYGRGLGWGGGYWG